MRFLFVDRILESIPGSLIRGIKHITADDFYLSRQHDVRPYFMSSLIGETLGQLAAWNVMAYTDFTHRPVAGMVSRAAIYRRAYVGETLLLQSYIDSVDDAVVAYHSEASIGQELIFTLEGALGPMLPMHDFIDDTTIRQQYAEINRPGVWQDVIAASHQHACIPYSSGHDFSTQYDSILAMEPGVGLTAEKRITRAAPYFADHFPHKPVLPLTILLESKTHLAYEFCQRQGWQTPYQLREMRRIKMTSFIYPGDIVQTTLQVKHRDAQELVLHYCSSVGGKRVCVVDMILTAKEDA